MKILIIHFRSAPREAADSNNSSTKQSETDSAGTDGVSLEMKKRRSMLEKMGHTVTICSAYDWAEYPIGDLEFDSENIRKLMCNMYENLEDYQENELENAFNESKKNLQLNLEKTINDFAPDMIMVHNILCLPIHPVATVALADLLK